MLLERYAVFDGSRGGSWGRVPGLHLAESVVEVDEEASDQSKSQSCQSNSDPGNRPSARGQRGESHWWGHVGKGLDV